jgi:hypothetical protein
MARAVKRFLTIWLAVSILMFVKAWSFGERNEAQSQAKLLQEKQLELNHSFAELKVEIAEKNLSSSEARDLMAQWYEESEKPRREAEDLRGELQKAERASQPAPQMPEVIPSRKVSGNEEFLDEVTDYFTKASRAFWDGVDTDDQKDFNNARDRFSRFMESEASQSLIKKSIEARNEIMLTMMRRPPMTRKEMAELAPEERLEEEIYVEVYKVMFDPVNRPEPIKDYQEWRDIMAGFRPMIEEKKRIFWESHPNLHLEKLRAQRAAITTQLENERIKSK